MMKYAICNETFQDWNWVETCRTVAELGYDGIEIAPFTLMSEAMLPDADERDVIRQAAQAVGLEIVGLHWLLVAPKGMSLTSDDETVRDVTAGYLELLTDCCADLGGRVMVLGSPAQRRLPNGNTALAQERLMAGLERCLKRAEIHGITICLEPLPKPEADFILTLEEAVTIVERIGHPNLKTIFDVKSASSESKPHAGLIREFAPYIAHVHANDANRRGPGFGETDYVPIFDTLKAVDYQGYVSVEVFDYTPDPVTIARESLRYMKECESQGE
jgi:sugar phosphate isomerase/epimerase